MKSLRPYEPEVDGLRALAVLCVVLYHAGVAKFNGGFVGVDVFFVISGYLITRNILSDCAAGGFSFKDFYMHRVRRILPAMYFTMALSAIAAPVVLSAGDLKQFWQSVGYSIFALPNIFFWMQAGYWDTARDFKPLLHFWSLGVEEQFYLFWPALLFLTYSRSLKSVAFLIVILSGLSLLAAQHVLKMDTTAVFYLTPFRIFEFGFGAFLVLLLPFLHRVPLWLKEGMIVLGLVGIILPILKYTEYTAFPGVKAIAPCLGAALVIAGRQARFTGFLFRNRVAVGIGLISYSLYLIHWPVFVFYKYSHMSEFSDWEKVFLIGVSIAAAWLMYLFIEQPFRRPAPLKHYARATVVPILFLLVCGAGAAAYAKMGQGGEKSFEVAAISRAIETAEHDRQQFLAKCLIPHKGACRRDNPAKKYMVIGDSYGEDVTISLFEIWTDYEFWLATDGGCTPMLNFQYKDATTAKRCNDRFNRIYDGTFPLNEYDGVVVSMHWNEDSIALLRQTVVFLQSHGAKRVIVAGPRVTMNASAAQIVAQSETPQAFNAMSRQHQDMARARKLQGMVLKEIDELGVDYIDLIKAQCFGSICPNIIPETVQPIIWDSGHWTLEGARYIGKGMKGQVEL